MPAALRKSPALPVGFVTRIALTVSSMVLAHMGGEYHQIFDLC